MKKERQEVYKIIDKIVYMDEEQLELFCQLINKITIFNIIKK